MTSGDRDYVARLGAVLRQRDVAALRAFLEEQAGRFGGEQQADAIRQQSDAELETLLHRMILARADLGDLHAESRRWLAGQGGSPGRGGPPGKGGSPGRGQPGRGQRGRTQPGRAGGPRRRSSGGRDGASGDGASGDGPSGDGPPDRRPRR